MENYYNYDGVMLKLKLSNWDRGLLVTCNVHHYLQSQKDKRTLKAIERKITTLRQNIDGMSSYHRRRKAKAKTVSNSTLLNEQATINALIKWLWREGYMHFDSFDFEKIFP